MEQRKMLFIFYKTITNIFMLTINMKFHKTTNIDPHIFKNVSVCKEVKHKIFHLQVFES